MRYAAFTCFLARAAELFGLSTVLTTHPGQDPGTGGIGMSNKRYGPEFKAEAVRRSGEIKGRQRWAA